MNKLIIFLFILFNFNNSYAEDKIRFIDLDFIINTSSFGKSIINDIQKFTSIKNDELLDLEKKLRESEEILIKTKNIISEEEYEKELLSLKKRVEEYNLKKNKYIKEINLFRQNETLKILEKINPIIEKYVADNQITIVLKKQDIVIANSENDITKFILDIVNKNLKWTNDKLK